jgi:hypothetical protein
MRMRFAAILAIAFLTCGQGMAATRIDDPAAFVRKVYAMLAADKEPPDDVYTPRLAALFALEKKESGGEVGRLDFSFWIDGQDSKISKLAVKAEPVESAPDRSVVTAKFHNIDRNEEIHFYFEKTKAGWLLDDVRSQGAENWTLSLILKYGWDSGN